MVLKCVMTTEQYTLMKKVLRQMIIKKTSKAIFNKHLNNIIINANLINKTWGLINHTANLT